MANLSALIDRSGVNAVVNYFNGELGNNIDNLRIEQFYNKVFLDTMELGRENFIHLSYASPAYIPAGHEKIVLKRYGGLTEHTTPLVEGVPPKSDKFRVESVEGTYHQYGRFMELTDKVSWNLIDPVVTIYSQKYGDLANKTKERLCRNEMLHSTSVLAPCTDIKHIQLTDKLTLNNYRIEALNMRRMLVDPINGDYHIIISPETKFDLITDDLINQYLGQYNGNKFLESDTVPKLFHLDFKETMMDDFAFGYELANPGELTVWDSDLRSTTKVLRIYAQDGDDVYYLNVDASKRTCVEGNISDGSYIPERVVWDVQGFLNNVSTATKYDMYDADAAGTKFTTDNTADSGAVTKLKSLVWRQLPIHKSIMLGKDAIKEIGIEGHTDSKIYTKPLGSAGVLDPIDQRQSVGFKIDAIGFTLLKPEACVVCYTVPTRAKDVNAMMYYAKGSTKGYTPNTATNVNPSMQFHSWDIPGKNYTQDIVDQGFNAYGKVDANGYVDTMVRTLDQGQRANAPANAATVVNANADEKITVFFTATTASGATICKAVEIASPASIGDVITKCAHAESGKTITYYKEAAATTQYTVDTTSAATNGMIIYVKSVTA